MNLDRFSEHHGQSKSDVELGQQDRIECEKADRANDDRLEPKLGLAVIPREDLIAMLKEQAWSSAGRPEFSQQGHSLDVREETALRDVNYRDEPLFATPEIAILAHWKRHYETKNSG